ncbi:MAG TPA: N-acetylmuramoyl-L-alanine amidase [Actinomycetota bacterium]|nr:N-acetylmuramoyl-L-alanine amidase [Actinomycetota bacterium]
MPYLTLGARGDAVLDVQRRLTSLGYHIDPSEHGEFGPTTRRAVQEFQQRRHLLVDGVIGEDTWAELVEAGYSLGDRLLYLRYPYDRGDDVRALQAALNVLGFDVGREDGIFGQRTDRAVREFQRNVGLPPDGIVGSTTIEAVARLRPVGPGPGLSTVREAEALRRMSASLQGSRIAVDPGHGPADPGAEGPSGLREADATLLMAEDLIAELQRRGAAPFLLRDRESDPSSNDRASAANDRGAELLVSLHLNSHPEAAAEGASTYYYGREGWSSQAGQRLAEIIQELLVSRLGRKDGRTHPKSLPLLRETHMPAVQVEPCFISNPNEESLLKDQRFRRDLAQALTEAIERFFGRPSGEAATSANDDRTAISLGGRTE